MPPSSPSWLSLLKSITSSHAGSLDSQPYSIPRSLSRLIRAICLSKTSLSLLLLKSAEVRRICSCQSFTTRACSELRRARWTSIGWMSPKFCLKEFALLLGWVSRMTSGHTACDSYMLAGVSHILSHEHPRRTQLSTRAVPAPKLSHWSGIDISPVWNTTV